MLLCSWFDKNLFNVIHLSIGFLVLFSADFTITNMQKTINASITEDDPSYTINGYVILCLLYGLYGISLWMAPSIISVIGYKMSLIIGGSSISFFLYSLTLETVWTTYVGTVIGGVGGAFLWVAEGQYLVLNSDEKTMPRNVSIFWAIYSASMIAGNIYAATQFEGKVHIDAPTRRNLLLVMGTAGIFAVIIFALLGHPPTAGSTYQEKQKPLKALHKTWKLFCTKDMRFLLVTFIYGGFQQSFGSGVYSPCLGFTKDFGNAAKQLVPISGLLYGIGDSLGGIIFMVLIKRKMKIQRRYVILTGFLIQSSAFLSIFLILPNSAVFGETDEISIIKPMIWLALLCSFFLGIGDSCLNTQIFPLLRDLHPKHSAHTASLYKFSKRGCISSTYN